MGIHKKSATHICNVIRRQIQAKFPDFVPFFILFDKENRQTVLEREARKILKHPAGQKILDYLRKPAEKTTGYKRTQLAGLADYYKKDLFGLINHHNTISVFFINLDDFDSEFSLKSQLLHMIWQALTTRDDYLRKEFKTSKTSTKPNFLEQDTFEIKDHVILPKLSADISFKRNLMADVFAASTLFLMDDIDAIRNLASLRMRDTLGIKDGFIGERYPFAVCAETLEFMLENNKLIHNRRSNAISLAYKIAEDMGENYTIPSIKYWKNFSSPAQHMAWLGFSPDVILGASIYTSENPYVRSIADMVVEYTGLEPEIITSIDDFNPFIGNERAKEIHKKACGDTFRKILLDASIHSNVGVFYEESRRQNQRLQAGNPFGWCAYSLIKFADIYREEFSGRYDLTQKAKVIDLFEQTQDEIPYEAILKFSILVFQKRRLGTKISFDDLAKLTTLSPEFELIGKAIEKSRKGVINIFQNTA